MTTVTNLKRGMTIINETEWHKHEMIVEKITPKLVWFKPNNSKRINFTHQMVDLRFEQGIYRIKYNN